MATPAVNMAPAKQGGSGAVKAAEASGKMNLEQLQHMINCTVKVTTFFIPVFLRNSGFIAHAIIVPALVCCLGASLLIPQGSS